MSRKRYISKTGIQYTFPVFPKGGKTVFISFGGSGNDYETSREGIQLLIEEHPKFKNGEIVLASVSCGDDVMGVKAVEWKEVTEVTDLQSAVGLLKGEPYGVDGRNLKTPEAIKKKARELGLIFPNLDV